MKLENVKKAMERNRIYSKEEASNAIEFLEDLLQDEISELQKEHPHATNTINRFKHAKEAVTSLYHDLNDIDELE